RAAPAQRIDHTASSLSPARPDGRTRIGVVATRPYTFGLRPGPRAGQGSISLGGSPAVTGGGVAPKPAARAGRDPVRASWGSASGEAPRGHRAGSGRSRGAVAGGLARSSRKAARAGRIRGPYHVT